jgi:hypothetical protein
MSAMGSCIKVVKQKKLVSCNRLKPKRPLFCHHMQKKGHFSVMGLHKISTLYAPSEIASQFPPPLRSKNIAQGSS